mmetsp:Transcript_10531/g.64625  ORF Transcript_10531/g.64625 Transcript_10531/m.64625 type:complete len:201 (-) Transcript_10531:569-1171(-)
MSRRRKKSWWITEKNIGRNTWTPWRVQTRANIPTVGETEASIERCLCVAGRNRPVKSRVDVALLQCSTLYAKARRRRLLLTVQVRGARPRLATSLLPSILCGFCSHCVREQVLFEAKVRILCATERSARARQSEFDSSDTCGLRFDTRPLRVLAAQRVKIRTVSLPWSMFLRNTGGWQQSPSSFSCVSSLLEIRSHVDVA